MINIKPRTYNEILRLTRCMAMKNYIPDLTDEKIEEMYNYLSQKPTESYLFNAGDAFLC